MSNLALKKKIGQLMAIGFDGKVVPEQVKELIHEYHIGSFILFGRNIGTPEEVLSLTRSLQLEAKKAGYERPLLICIDQENGVVRRLGEGTTIFPGAMALGATAMPNNAQRVGYATALELKALGINWNLAPVLDVNNNPNNPVIGVRSFGELPEVVGDFGLASMKGMQEAGIATTLKHFPGHGDTNVDSHLDLPTIAHNIDRLEQVELVPFKACIQHGADAVMTAHVYFPAIEKEANVPATLSKKVITGLLREKLGFIGVVTTDCLEMNAISQTIGVERGAVEALKAGVDVLMVSHRYSWQVNTIKEVMKAVENGEIKEESINLALSRIAALKAKYLNWEELHLEEESAVPSVVGSDGHIKDSYDVYKQAVTVVKDDALPLTAGSDQRIFVMFPERNKVMMVEDKRYSAFDLGKVIQEFHPNTETHQFPLQLNDAELEELVSKAAQYDTIIIGTLTALPGSSQISLIERLFEKGCSIIVVAMRSPYDLSYLPDVSGYIATYEFSYPALKVAAGVIFGLEKVSGMLPVTVKRR